ncbi:MAG: glycoside hydrolase family 127 protein [Planctomycetota bacterium]|nr:MAG: glycoside hydrolase family 127 protein [Planctomycetota bacterium]
MHLARALLMTTSCTLLAAAAAADEPHYDYPIQPVPFTAVKVDEGLWHDRIETNRTVTIPYDFKKCEETGRIANFVIAGDRLAGRPNDGRHRGFWFNDSDVFKVIEGAAYSLALTPDEKLDAYLDDLIAKIAASQEEDGYLYTIRSAQAEIPERMRRYTGATRWSYLEHSHELYNVGHLYEAAVAHYQATGKRTLLDVALKNADLVDRLFGEREGQMIDVPGHQEIEIGLVKLYRLTGEKRFLDLAKFFLDRRGVPAGRKENRVYGEYWQDHQPVTEQSEAVGHAVRAAYMYSAMADVAALTGERDYVEAIDRLWDNVAGKKMYLTGGIGSRHSHESFGDNYELPNESAYNETCAAIGNAMWNHRMFLLHGDAKYMDVVERVLYNGFLAGISLEGDKFFYPNPLSCRVGYRFNKGAEGRSPWFDCSCCPVNIVRFIPSIAGMIYAQREDDVFVNLLVPGSTELEVRGRKVKISQETLYPWQGRALITVRPEEPVEFALKVRIPGWSRGEPVGTDLYRYRRAESTPRRCGVLDGEGEEIVEAAAEEDNFFVLKRKWDRAVTVLVDFEMPIRRVYAHDKVASAARRVALERGPLVYCIEAADNEDRVPQLVIREPQEDPVPELDSMRPNWQPELLGGVVVIEGHATTVAEDAEGNPSTTDAVPFTAIPYYAWNHRGNGQMRVWIPTDPAVIEEELAEARRQREAAKKAKDT